MADELKAQGNKAFTEKRFDEAIDFFSQAIELDPKNHVLYSNRSGAYASKRDFTAALADANKVVEIKPDWAKGWSRVGAAQHGEGDLIKALDAYEEALKIDPANAQAKGGLDAVKRAIDAEAKADGQPADMTGGLGGMFNDPQLIQKLAANPKTSGLLADGEFMAKLKQVQQNPDSVGMQLGDPRFLQVLGVLMGVDIQTRETGDASAEAAAMGGEVTEEIPTTRSPPPKYEAKSETKAEPEDEPMEVDEDAAEKKKLKEQADKEKLLGTENYKKRKFDEAIGHYSKAWELYKDITYLTNLAAAKFEKGDYDGCIEECKRAIEEGREIHADFKLIAKAFGRIGSAYEKKGDLASAIDNYQRSLTEHRTPEILTKLRAAEKLKITSEKAAYVDPAKAEEARELGNAKFKAADWPAAVEAYSEMIKRAPKDPRGYSNRAAAFVKLMSFPSAVQDCDEAIKVDPKFVRAHIRKAQALFAMREYSRCIDACNAASDADTENQHTREIEKQMSEALSASHTNETEEETMARIQKDPEILSILQDPVMQSILQQAKGDPGALQEHMKNAQVRAKIQKLVAAGVIRMGTR